jgi:hypothetical protein
VPTVDTTSAMIEPCPGGKVKDQVQGKENRNGQDDGW